MTMPADQHIDDLSQQFPPVLVEQALHLINQAQTIALLAHERPDGDCLGSALGLAHILRLMNKTCVPVCADPTPRAFTFLPGIDTLQHTLGEPGKEPFDLVIALDAGDLTRYGAISANHQAFLQQVPILNIDHHVSSNGCGQVNIIDPTMAATAEMLALFQQQAGLPLNLEAATCLLTGLITDTGSFQYSNTTPRTVRTAALLLETGANPEKVIQAVFHSRPLSLARYQAAAIDKAQLTCEGRLIWSYATDETLVSTGLTPDLDNNCSGMLRDIDGVQIAAFFKSFGNPSKTQVSLRSHAPYDVSRVCMRLGGGGHPRAAGITIQQPLQETINLVIAELKQEITETDHQLQILTGTESHKVGGV